MINALITSVHYHDFEKDFMHLMQSECEPQNQFGDELQQQYINIDKILMNKQDVYSVYQHISVYDKYDFIFAFDYGSTYIAGMIKSLCSRPIVIGIPVISDNLLHGLDTYLSMLNMPKGSPVITVGNNRHEDAYYLFKYIIKNKKNNIQNNTKK